MRVALPALALALAVGCTSPRAPRQGTQIGAEGDPLPCEVVEELVTDFEADDELGFSAGAFTDLVEHTATGIATEGAITHHVSLQLLLDGAPVFERLVEPEGGSEVPCTGGRYIVPVQGTFSAGDGYSVDLFGEVFASLPGRLGFVTEPLPNSGDALPPRGSDGLVVSGFLEGASWMGELGWSDAPPHLEWQATLD